MSIIQAVQLTLEAVGTFVVSWQMFSDGRAFHACDLRRRTLFLRTWYAEATEYIGWPKKV